MSTSFVARYTPCTLLANDPVMKYGTPNCPRVAVTASTAASSSASPAPSGALTACQRGDAARAPVLVRTAVAGSARRPPLSRPHRRGASRPPTRAGARGRRARALARGVRSSRALGRARGDARQRRVRGPRVWEGSAREEEYTRPIASNMNRGGRGGRPRDVLASRAAVLRALRVLRGSTEQTVLAESAYARTSFLYATRCGWSASGPFRFFRSSMQD